MSNPVVSIGLPVYNGEKFVSQAIESVLSQTFTALELVISDNASTDGTQKICQEWAKNDSRVRYYRATENGGAAWNFNRTVKLACGTYFRWLAADDLLAPTLIEESVKILDAKADVAVCITYVEDIDEFGNRIRIKRSSVGGDAATPYERFQGLSTVRSHSNCEEVFGMMRLDTLHTTKLIDNYSDSDRTLMADLGLHGRYFEIPTPLFMHRLHGDGSVAANPSRYDRMAWFDPDSVNRLIVLPNWRQLLELLIVIWKAPISLREQLLCYRHMVYWIKRRRNYLRRDFVWVFQRMRFGIAVSIT